MSVIQQATRFLQKFDRLPNNPDDDRLEKMVQVQLAELGLIRLLVFACPKFDTEALLGPEPEKYMPVSTSKDDLFRPRVPKIVELREGMQQLGIITEPNIILGDNDAEIYIFPFLEEVKIDSAKYRQRQKQYEKSFDARIRRLLGDVSVAWSLSDLEIGLDEQEPKVSQEEMQRELKFFEWLFSSEGPYKDALTFSEKTLRRMVRRKFRLYGRQGRFLEELGGVLLQTKGPGVWLQRTRMLRSTGAKSVPAIYPWIRSEELKETKHG